MTNLQVEYWKFEESARTNRANESLRGRELKETHRHNVAAEQIEWAKVGETSRHNKEQEKIGWYNAYTDRTIKSAQAAYYNVQTQFYPQVVNIKQKEADTRQFQVNADYAFNRDRIQQGWANIFNDQWNLTIKSTEASIKKQEADTKRKDAETKAKDAQTKRMEMWWNIATWIVDKATQQQNKGVLMFG